MSVRRCVIVAAGEIHNYERARTFLHEDDFFIFCELYFKLFICLFVSELYYQ